MNKRNKNTLKQVLHFTEKNKSLLLFSLFLTAVYTVSILYIPVLAGKAIDCVIGKGNVDFATMKLILIQISVLAVSAALIQWLIGSLNNRITVKTVYEIRNTAVEKLHKLPISYIDKNPAGKIISIIISDADQVSEGLLMGFNQLFAGLLTIIGTLIFMLKISLIMTPVVVVLTPLSLAVAKFVAKHTHEMFLTQSKARSEQTEIIDESVSNRKVISAYSAETTFRQKFENANNRYADSSLKAIFYSSITNPSTRFVNNIIYACVALVGAICALNGKLTIGMLACFLSYAGQYAKPFNEISGVIAELQNAFACSERIFELIGEAEEKPDNSETCEITDVKGNISLDNVSFSYDKAKDLIKDFSLEAPEGSKIAIVGPTGCGKTTVVNLLLRFYDADSGKICLDSLNINEITRKSLRSSYGMVLQDTWIKSGTVEENIKFGKPDATIDEIVNAAKLAHAHSFIKRLPDGYNTIISDDNSVISQGQKQLLCIARIFLNIPPVLILDEATSSIDTRTEMKIQDAFTKLTKGRTSFIVAHRLSTIINSDTILVMKDGMIIEKGTHKELLEMHGFYEQLYNSRLS